MLPITTVFSSYWLGFQNMSPLNTASEGINHQKESSYNLIKFIFLIIRQVQRNFVSILINGTRKL